MYDPADDPHLRVIRPLGEGGTANVVLAHHGPLNRAVAIKYGKSQSADVSASFADLILREYDLIGGYRFPGLVRPLLPPPTSGDHLILEFCPGPTLGELGRVDNINLALNIISAISADLEWLRVAGLVHGDLKPQNVFLPQGWATLQPGQPFFVKLSDLSLGRRLDEPEDMRLGLGTIGFMAPETILSHRAGPRSDLFALGVIAYQLLSGRHPFMEEDSEPVKVNSRICEQEPEPLAKQRPGLSEGVYHLVDRLLSKSDEARPESGQEVCEVLEREGATYSYEQVLKPTFLIRKGSTYQEVVARTLDLSEGQRQRLDELTEESLEQLSLILTGNFMRRCLIYKKGRFRFERYIYWPGRMRSNTLRQFSRLKWPDRRAAVRAAIAGGIGVESESGGFPPGKKPSLPRALPSLLLPLLKPTTVKQLATRLAPVAERENATAMAARMYLQAGNLDEAERCADLAAREFTRHDRKTDAMSVLFAVDRYARLLRREFDIRRTLLLKANLHKESGELDVAESAYRRIVRLYQDRQPDKLLAETHKHLGDLYRMKHDTGAALQALSQSLAIFQQLGDDLEISHTLTNIGNVHWIANDTRQARKQYREAFRIQERLEAKADLASTLHNIATTYCFDGRFKRGIVLLTHALHMKKEIGNLGEIARTLNNLGYAYQMMGSPAKAAESLTESLEINRRIGSKKELLYNLENLVSLRIAAGQLRESRELLEEGLTLADSQNLTASEGPFHLYAATIARRQGCYAEATASLGRIERLLESVDDPNLELTASVQKARLRLAFGDSSTALELARRAHEESLRTRNSVVELESLLLLTRLSEDSGYWDAGNVMVTERRLVREKRILSYGRVELLLDQKRTDDAWDVARSELDVLEEVDPDLELPWMRTLGARLHVARGDQNQALKLLKGARQQAHDTGLRPELIISLTLLGQIAREKGDYEQAYALFKQALGVCREVAGYIPTEADRQLYLSRPMVLTLSEEIKSLGQELGQKARADR